MGRRINGTGQRLSPFMAGLAHIFDIRSNFRPRPKPGAGRETAAEALRSDWAAIGRDMQVALAEFERQESKRTTQP